VTRFGLRKGRVPLHIDPLRQAMMLLAPFARTHRGVFVLDGPAIESASEDSTGNALDVYCLFPEESMIRASRMALSALRPLASDIRIHRGEGNRRFLAEICKRSLVVGDRRRVNR